MSGPKYAMELGEENRFSLEEDKMLIAFFSELLILFDHWFLDQPVPFYAFSMVPFALFLSMLLE